MNVVDPKRIVRAMQRCADGIAIYESDLHNLDNLDETFEYLSGEILPEIILQVSYMQGLREKLRSKAFDKSETEG